MRTAPLLLAILVTLTLAACGSNEPAPTPTARPTLTPYPTARPTATPTPDDTEYRMAVAQVILITGRDRQNIGGLMAEVELADLVSIEWQTKMFVSIDNAVTAAREFRRSSSPPPIWEPFDTQFTKALDGMVDAMTLLKSGVTNLNPDTIADAASRMEEANDRLEAARSLIPKR